MNETIETAEEYYDPEDHKGCSPVIVPVKGEPGLRIWADLGVDSKTGGWRIRMPAGEEDCDRDHDEEGNVWISQEVIDVILESQQRTRV